MNKFSVDHEIAFNRSPSKPDYIEMQLDYLFNVAGDEEAAVWVLEGKDSWKLYRFADAHKDPLLRWVLSNADVMGYPEEKKAGKGITKAILVLIDEQVSRNLKASDCWLIKKPVGKFEWVRLPPTSDFKPERGEPAERQPGAEEEREPGSTQASP